MEASHIIIAHAERPGPPANCLHDRYAQAAPIISNCRSARRTDVLDCRHKRFLGPSFWQDALDMESKERKMTTEGGHTAMMQQRNSSIGYEFRR
jgi:hypothetical protein